MRRGIAGIVGSGGGIGAGDVSGVWCNGLELWLENVSDDGLDGMDDPGGECRVPVLGELSGVVVAGMSAVLGVRRANWPRVFRGLDSWSLCSLTAASYGWNAVFGLAMRISGLCISGVCISGVLGVLGVLADGSGS